MQMALTFFRRDSFTATSPVHVPLGVSIAGHNIHVFKWKCTAVSSILNSLCAACSATTSQARVQTSAPSRQTTGAALSQAGNSLRKVQSPGMLLAAAALQGDRLMARIMSQVRQDCFVTVWP